MNERFRKLPDPLPGGRKPPGFLLRANACLLALLLGLLSAPASAWALREPGEPQTNERARRTPPRARQAADNATAQAAANGRRKAPQAKPLPKRERLPEAPKALKRRQVTPQRLRALSTGRSVIMRAVWRHLTEHPEWLQGLPSHSFRVKHYAVIPPAAQRPGMAYVQLAQRHDDREVDATYVHFSIKLLPEGPVVVGARAQVYPELSLRPPALRPSAEIDQRAAEGLGLDASRWLVKKRRARIRYLEGQWRRVQEIDTAEEDLRVIVDEETGETWSEDLRYYEIQGNVRGRGVRFDPGATGSSLPMLDLKDLKVTAAGGTTAYTDAAGAFTFPSLNAATTLSATLQGRWAAVTSATSPALSASTSASPGGTATLLFNPAGTEELATAQVNGYHHTTFIHDWVQAHLPARLPAVDIPIAVRVNIDDTCNAYYTQSTINFFKAGDGCINTAFDTVIYHEYGHFVDDMIGGIPDGGLSEGWGDIFAAFSSSQPLLGENWVGAGTYLRTADNDYQYPPSGNDEVHELGQAWAGFAWHLRENLMADFGTAEGIRLTDTLIVPVLMANSEDIPAAVNEVILLDDNDGTLANGTPHLAQILRAAQQHRLPVREVLAITEPLWAATFSPAAQTTVTVRGRIGVDFTDYTLAYGRGDNPSTWLPVVDHATTLSGDVLGQWNIQALADDIYTLKLDVTTAGGLQLRDVISVEINRNPPRALAAHANIQQAPAIDGDFVVWEDWRRDTPQEFHQDIYRYDLARQEEQRLTPETSFWYGAFPAISDRHVVWMHWHMGMLTNGWDIYRHDETLGRETAVTTSLSDQRYPAISGNYIVWQDDRHGNWDIYLYDLSTRQERRITTNTGHQLYPAISGNRIVWEDLRDGQYEIYLYDLLTNTERRMTNQPQHQYAADISDHRIVWQDTRHDRGDIYLYDLLTNTERRITSNPNKQQFPRIHGSSIVWHDDRDGQYEIYRYDLTTNTEHRVTFNPEWQIFPDVSGSRIVWQDSRNDGDIYYLDLAAAPTPNQPPVLAPIGAKTVREGQSLLFAVSATDPEQQVLTYTASNLPSEATFAADTRTFGWTPPAGAAGTYNVTFTVTDTGGLTDAETVPITVQPQPQGLRGRVLRLDGATPLGSARVEVLQGTLPKTSVTASPEGAYAFATLAAGTYSLRASKAGFVTTTVPNVIVGTGETVQDVRLPMLATFSGTVRDGTTQAPILSASIQLKQGTSIKKSAISAADGTFHLTSITPDTYTLVISKASYAPTTRAPFLVADGAVLTEAFELGPGVRLEGIIAHGLFDTPVAGASVQLKQNGVLKISTTSSATGSYTLNTVLPADTYELVVIKTGFVTRTIPDLDLTLGPPVRQDAALQPILQEGVSLYGRVTDGASPVSGASVQLKQGTVPKASAVTTATGHYLLTTTLLAGDYTLAASKTGYPPYSRADFFPAGLTPREITLGAVNHAPLADAGLDQTVTSGARVTLNASGSSDPDGDPLTFAWRQLEGSTIPLEQADSAQAVFTAPAVETLAELRFEVRADDGQAQATDAVTVTVEPLPVPDVPARDIKLIYFVPPDRAPMPDYAARLRTATGFIQRYYADQMQAHGHGSKTFRFVKEPGTTQAKVWFVQGSHPNDYYCADVWGRIMTEVDAAVPKEDDILFVFGETWKIDPTTKQGYCGTALGGNERALIDVPFTRVDTMGADETEQLPAFCNNARSGVDEPFSRELYADEVSVGELASRHFGGATHEVGHAFGLSHQCYEEFVLGRPSTMCIGFDGFRKAFTACGGKPAPALTAGDTGFLNFSRWFNPPREYTDEVMPTGRITSHADYTEVPLEQEQLRVQVALEDAGGSGLGFARFFRSGDGVGGMPLPDTATAEVSFDYPLAPGELVQLSGDVVDRDGNSQMFANRVPMFRGLSGLLRAAYVLETPFVFSERPAGNDAVPLRPALTRDYLGGEAAVRDVTPGGTVAGHTWKIVGMDPASGAIDFEQAGTGADFSVNYAYVAVTAPQSMPLELRVGSDDAVRVWLNGALVHDHLAVRPATFDEDRVAVTLQAGENRLLIKVLNAQGGFRFFARLCETATGQSRPELNYSPLAVNEAPRVFAGADRTVAGLSVALEDATVEDDGQYVPPDQLVLEWSQESGPGTVSFLPNPHVLHPTALFSEPGAYRLRLTAFDLALSAADDVTMTVENINRPPRFTSSFLLPGRRILEDFDGTSLIGNWWDADGATVYQRTIAPPAADGAQAMQVAYDKAQLPWSFFAAEPLQNGQANNFSPADRLTFWLRGGSDLLVKLEDQHGGIMEQSVAPPNDPGVWREAMIDLHAAAIDLAAIKNVFFFAAPGLANVSDRFSLDRLSLRQAVALPGTAGQALAWQLTAQDPDQDALTFTAAGLPEGAALNAATGQLTWTPAPAQTGEHRWNVFVNDAGGLSDSAEMLLTVQPAPAAGLSGRVLRLDGHTPIAAARVDLLQGTTTKATQSSAGDGGYHFATVAPGTYNVRVIKAGFATTTVTDVLVTPEAGVLRDVRIPKLATVRGTVRHALTQEPLSGASVQLKVGGTSKHAASSTTDGRFAMTTVVPGTYSLVATKAGYQATTPVEVVVEDGAALEGHNPSLTPGVSLQGTVRATADQSVMPGVMVQIRQGNTIKASAQSDANGAFRLSTMLPPSTYDVVATKAGWATWIAPHRALVAGPNTQDIQLASASNTVTLAVHGRISRAESTTGIERATVQLVQLASAKATATTNATGLYTLNAQVPPGWYTLKVSAPNYQPQVIELPEITEAADRVQDAILVRGPSVQGTVRECLLNSPLASARVELRQGTSSKASVLTSPAGTYLMPTTLPDGVYDLVIARTGYVLHKIPNLALAGGSVLSQEAQLCPATTLPAARLTRLTTDPAMQKHPFISGDFVVWEDSRHRQSSLGPGERYNIEVYLHDLRSSEAVRITTTTAQTKHAPVLDGSRIAWAIEKTAASGATAADAYFCDYAPGSGCQEPPRQIAADTHWPVDVAGDRFAWEEVDWTNSRDYNVMTCAYDPATGLCPKQPLTERAGNQNAVQISGDLAAWLESTGAAPTSVRLYLRDLAQGQELHIATMASISRPTLDNHRLVWVAKDAQNRWDAYACLYDPAAGTCPVQRLTNTSVQEKYPAVAGDRAVWVTETGGLSTLWAHSFSSGNTDVVTALPTTVFLEAGDLSLSGNRVVWDGRTDGVNWDVYLIDLAPPSGAGAEGHSVGMVGVAEAMREDEETQDENAVP